MNQYRYTNWMREMLNAFWRGMLGRFGLSTADKPNRSL
jgi:hypothetical protein